MAPDASGTAISITSADDPRYPIRTVYIYLGEGLALDGLRLYAGPQF